MWVAEMLTRAGLPTAHEDRITSAGLTDGTFRGESSAFAPFFFDQLRGVVVVHLLRDPYETIRCMLNKRALDDPVFTTLNWRMDPPVPKVTAADHYAEFWVGWNLAVYHRAQHWWRIGGVSRAQVMALGHAVGAELDPWAVDDALELEPLNRSSGEAEVDLSWDWVALLDAMKPR